MKKKSKKILTVVLVLVLVAGIAVGGVLVWQSQNQKAVKVYSVSDFSMTGYYGDSSATTGNVELRGLQQVELSDTQTITEIKVQVGDTVKKGDVLLTYDTTLTQLELDRAELEIQQLELDLSEAEKELAVINTYKPGVYIPGSVTTTVIPGTPAEVEEAFEDDGTLTLLGGDGSEANPFIYQWNESYSYTSAFLYQCSRGLRDAFVTFVETEGSAEHTHTEDGTGWHYTNADGTANTENHWKICSSCGEAFDAEAHTLTWVVDQEATETEAGSRHQECSVCGYKGEAEEIPATGSTDPETPETPEDPEPETPENVESTAPSESGDAAEEATDVSAVTLSATAETASTVVETSAISVEDAESSWTVEIQNDDGSYTLQLLSIRMNGVERTLGERLPELPAKELDPGTPDTVVTDGISYTATEIATMKTSAEQKVKEADLSLRQAQLQLKTKQAELNNGSVVSTMDGEVTSVLTEDEAREQNQPLITVSSGGGYYIQGTVSELARDSVTIGQTVTVGSYNYDDYSVIMCEGTVVEILDYPTTNDSYYGGNTNVSYYPFTVFVPADAGLTQGAYAEMVLGEVQTDEYGNLSGDSSNLYLESMFIRTENGKSYVYVRGDDGTLEKRYLSTGASLYGSYTEIKSGLTVDDYIAFPYGSGLEDGAATEEGTMDEFYGY